jgi:hypothetical protein
MKIAASLLILLSLAIAAGATASPLGAESALPQKAKAAEGAPTVAVEDDDEAPAAPAAVAPEADGLPTVSDLMVRKIDLLQKAEKIEKIEAVVGGAVGAGQPRAEGRGPEYRPLRDEAGKSVEASPPFFVEKKY